MEDRLNKSFEESLNLRSLIENEELLRQSYISQDRVHSVENSPSKVSVSSQDSRVRKWTQSKACWNVGVPCLPDEFEYDIIGDIDSRISFYEQDFEEFYKSSREAELSNMTRDELIANVISMEHWISLKEKTDSNCVETKDAEESEEERLLALQNELKALKMRTRGWNKKGN